MNRKTILLVVLVVALVVGGIALVKMLSPGVQEVTKVASDMSFAPFEYIDEETKDPAGFDIEIMQALGKAMDMKVEMVNTAWDGILPGLIAGNYDLVISAMTISDERVASVDFSDPYFATGQVIVVKQGDQTVTEPKDLISKRIGVQIGTTGHIAADKIEGADVRPFQIAPDAFLALKAGQVDAVVVDELVAIEELKANPDSVEIVGRPFTAEYYGIAIKKGNTELLKKVNKALAQIKADGTYDKIYEKYMDAEQ